MEAVGAVKAIGKKTVETVPLGNQTASHSSEAARGHGNQNPGSPRLDAISEGEDRIERIAEAMENYVRSVQRELNIRVDQDSGRVIVKVLSKDTGEVIREIPPEELLKLASRMEEMAGLLFNKNA